MLLLVMSEINLYLKVRFRLVVVCDSIEYKFVSIHYCARICSSRLLHRTRCRIVAFRLLLGVHLLLLLTMESRLGAVLGVHLEFLGGVVDGMIVRW